MTNELRAWAPSSGVLPNIYNKNEDEDEDVYCPGMANEGIDLEEGLGDSNDILGTTIRVSGEFNEVVLNTSQGTLSEVVVRGRGVKAVVVRKEKGTTYKSNSRCNEYDSSNNKEES
ncbi:uncharacterized protein LOC129289338 [Prosopis cineraria]|uniref:uncharacterized protein LOC129289338 n=1 Tax=Prosopis cineraria TaxID=364024 RepID=UPI00240ECC91|nr:uncharacterized protein LOC129289338 [Prosopis cineraria]